MSLQDILIVQDKQFPQTPRHAQTLKNLVILLERDFHVHFHAGLGWEQYQIVIAILLCAWKTRINRIGLRG